MLVGLTGGIASGKSTVSQLIADYGFPIVDADIGAREVVKKGTPGLRRIQDTFGDSVILPSGSLDRKQLGKIVFTDAEKRKTLNRILSKDIRQWIKEEAKKAMNSGASLVVLDIPLLFEADYDKVVDQTMVVFVTEEVQLERLMKRNGYSREEAMNRIRSQMPLSEKAKKADIVIDNNGTIEETKQQITNWLMEEGFLEKQ